MEIAGIHLDQTVGRENERRSAVALVGGDGCLTGLVRAGPDEDILAALPGTAALAIVDAPLVVRNDSGRRDLEELLAWCDHPTFPVARRRLLALHGGIRGEGLGRAAAERGHGVVEALPDLVLRQLHWERGHPLGTRALDLRDYREAWLSVKAPVFRPRGRRPARADGVDSAYALLAAVLDLSGWRPAHDPDAALAAADSAFLDAIACAYAGWRAARGAGAVVIGSPDRGRMIVPADANLEGRLRLHAERLQTAGGRAITIADGRDAAGLAARAGRQQAILPARRPEDGR